MARKSYYRGDEDISEYMGELCTLFGHDPRAVSWSSRSTQQIRFEILSDIADLNHQSILDVGCGQADFYPYVTSKMNLHYTGIDFSSEMISFAKRHYPEGFFHVENFLNPKFKTKYDYVICSGALNYHIPNQETFIKRAILKLWSHAKKGVAFNLLSPLTPQSEREEEGLYYYNPEEILTYCKTITPHLKMIQDYLPNDFTIYLYGT